MFKNTLILIACNLGITAQAMAQVPPSTSVKKVAQPAYTQSQLLALKPLVKYLRCEGDVLNEFGESKPPLGSLGLLIPDKSKEGLAEPVYLEVWPGIQAEIKGAAGYGFLALWQRYPLSSKHRLLKTLRADDWQLERSPMSTTQQIQNSTIINEMVGVYRATKPIDNQPGRTRTLTLVEAEVSLTPGELDLNSFSVLCAYSAGTKPK
jgi:hypothetical protein